jgi:hypothetical protein
VEEEEEAEKEGEREDAEDVEDAEEIEGADNNVLVMKLDGVESAIEYARLAHRTLLELRILTS